LRRRVGDGQARPSYSGPAFARTEAENHTIGIVPCKRKNSALVEITLPEDANIHAREYQLYLPSKEELQQKLVEWLGEQDGQDD
jgi:hypothetical protein